MVQITGFVLIGLLAGILSGLFGIGGGLIIIPALILFFKMNQHLAQGTSLGALLLPVGLLGFLEYWRNGNVHIKGALLIALGLFIGAFFGAYIANIIPTKTLSKLFALFLIMVALKLFFGK
ncbi:MAG: TSUP family transporter [candidate division WOR-3 bacterium]